MRIPHILLVALPAQGHVMPMMELAQIIAKHGFKVTFVNTEFIHKRIMSNNVSFGDGLHLVSVPDGLEPWEDRNNLGKLLPALLRVMPGKLQEIIENEADDTRFTCVIAEITVGWLLEIAVKFSLTPAIFCPPSAASLAVIFSLPKLIENGIVENDGNITKHQMIQLSPTMPAISTETFTWACFRDLESRNALFQIFVDGHKYMKMAEWIFCNSAYELEPATFTSFPQMLPIGPLSSRNGFENRLGSFWPEDSGCLSWLDQQPACSVIYIAFGSLTVFDQEQFQELALGLELTNKPFLWVVRPDMTNDMIEAYPKGYKERIGSRGNIVSWTTQEKVLSHPSIACFLSHCGWNSTMEGISNGVPFLCWPYFGDQLFNVMYICDDWKVGLKCDKNERGIVSKDEIKNKLEQLIGDKNFKARAMNLKERVLNSVAKDGCSYKNLSKFIGCLK